MDSMADSNKLDIWNKSFSNPYVYNGRSQTMGELWCRIEVLQLTQLEEAAILELRSPLWRPLRGPFSTYILRLQLVINNGVYCFSSNQHDLPLLD